MNIRMLGTRGSYPAIGKEYQKYGQNTSCVEVTAGDQEILFDAGTGIADAKTPKLREAHLFLSHFHTDHLCGLYRFLYRPDIGTLHIYGMPGVEAAVKNLFRRPYWPVGADTLAVKLVFHELDVEDTVTLQDGVMIHARRGNHPGGSLLYRVEQGKKSFVYGLDHELDPEDKNFRQFCEGADAMVFDAAYTPEQLKDRKGWGHSDWVHGIQFRKAAGIKEMYLSHYSDDKDEALVMREVEAGKIDCHTVFAKEGMEITL